MFFIVAGLAAGGLVVPLVAAYGITLTITDWEAPPADIVQGCDTSLTCAEGPTFFIAAAAAFVLYLVAAAWWWGRRYRRWRARWAVDND